MPRPPNIIRPTYLHMALPEDARTKLDLLLHSPLEGRVPKGAYQKFFLERMWEFFTWRRLALTPYGFPEGYFVAGPKGMLDTLETKLKGTPS